MMNLHLGFKQGLAGALALSAFVVGLMGYVQPANAAIADTKHNLGTTGSGSNHVTTGTGEICVFCHTPHGADSVAGAPLWNKDLTTMSAATYDMYNVTSTLDSGDPDQPLGVSLACLSCHDGTQAMDNIINAPGSGGYTADGGSTNGLGYTWQSSSRVNAAGIMQSATVAMLGTDLTNDHPISIPYCGGGANVVTTTTGDDVIDNDADCNDHDFKDATVADFNGSNHAYIDVNNDSSRQKTDIFLYAADASAIPTVQCASCHDVHGGVSGTVFLRVSQTGSGLCLACHTK